jgi:serine protease AprX
VERFRVLTVIAILVFSSLPVTGIDGPSSESTYFSEIPKVKVNYWNELPWWETTSRDLNRNGIVDWLEGIESDYPIGVLYNHEITSKDIELITEIGIEIRYHATSVNGLLLGTVDSNLFQTISDFPGVLMIEPYGKVVFYGDVQTPAIKASNSSVYPEGAWDLGVTGKGVNVAIVDTGIDNEHPGLEGKFVAGFDAVCTDDVLCMASLQEDDGSFDPDDQNQHGTACSGMATSTGVLPSGEPSNFTGSAPDAKLVDVRIGTALGAGPFENYILEQEFYESAMNGIQWVIDNKDTEWPDVENESYGIDIISLSWGITSHEDGGSDGTDMFSQILDEATLAGIAVSVAAGNDGSDNDGLSGMGSSSLSITVGALDDKNSIDRVDDGIASYSSRGPRRDNNDGNPYDEMKPDVSAPGTNIVQAEACHASGGCYNRIPGQDASGNGYSGRGSGTSYATPSVSGVIALIIEANSDLNALEIREILRLTAERKDTLSSADGEGVEEGPWATSPELDPYWNRHFGWGMVDAHAAVKSALVNTDTENINVDLQTYVTDTQTGWQTGSGITTITGHSWSRSGLVDRIEYSVDGHSWKSVKYAPGTNESIYIDWEISLSVSDLAFTGDHVVLVRSVDADGMHSISAHSEFYAYGESSGSSSTQNMALLVAIGALLLVGIAVTVYRKKFLN